MNLITAFTTLAQDELEVSRLMGKVIAGVVILIVVLVVIKAVKGKGKK